MKQSGSIAVLGGLGFMGSHLCRKLAQTGFRVRIFDRAPPTRDSSNTFDEQIEIIEGDMSRCEDVLAGIGDSQVVINFIHTTVPGSSMANPQYDITSNVAGTVGWLQQLDKTNVRRILYVSSGGTVYGVPESVPITEDHPTNPINSYGITKLAIEKYTAMFSTMFGIDYCILRPSNVYGPGQRLNVGQGVVGVLASRALEGSPLEIWGTGDNLRDYLFIDDLTRALLALISYEGRQRVFNISTGIGHSVLEIISILQNQIGPLPDVIHHQDRGFDTPANILDASRIRTETGWQPTVDLETGILRTIQWLQNSKQ